MESSSWCSSSGCQSGWTLYLDHSNGGGDHRQCCSLHCKNRQLDDLTAGDEQEEPEDSMVSDASSGPPPHLRDQDDEPWDHQARRQLQSRQRRHDLACHGAGYDDVSGSSGGSRSVGFGSATALSTSSHGHGLAEVIKRKRRKRRATVGEDDDASTAVMVVLRRHDHDHDHGSACGDDLDDTASSSSVSSLQPSCAFSVRHLQQRSSAAVQGTTILQAGYAMLHRN